MEGYSTLTTCGHLVKNVGQVSLFCAIFNTKVITGLLATLKEKQNVKKYLI